MFDHLSEALICEFLDLLYELHLPVSINAPIANISKICLTPLLPPLLQICHRHW